MDTVGAEEAYEFCRLREVFDMIAESVIVRHVCLPSAPVAGCCQTTWGCGICGGEYQGRDDPATERGVYAHKNWCPRKP